MEPAKILPPRTKIYIVTGISGMYDEKTSWVSMAYTEKSYADKAAILLNRLSDKINNVEPDSDKYWEYNNLIKSYDDKAFIQEGLYYFVEEVMVTV